jgi:putative ABC transport system permease protein
MAWLDETHGPPFELIRHFVVRFFDSELVTTAGEWRKFAIGVGAVLFSLGIIAVSTYWKRYDYLQAPALSTPQLYRQGIHADLLSFIALAMVITALLTILQWQSLFPSLRDCLALAGFPVRQRQIFFAKFTALLLLFAAFVLAMNLPWAILFAEASSGQWQQNSTLARATANFAALGGACSFVFFGLLSLQGVLLHLLPGRVFTRVSQVLQASLFMAILGALPLLGRQPAAAPWWPPVWFLSLGRTALLATVLPAFISVLAYLLSYHRYQRMLLEAPPARIFRLRWPLERWIPDPREQAAFAFIWKTLTRSALHRLLLLAFGGLALGWMIRGALDTPRPSLRDEGLFGLAVVMAPLALSVLATVGLRYLFSIPVALRANWVFRITDGRGRRAWLAAVERFAVYCGIAPIFGASLGAAMAIFGWLRAFAVTLLGLLTALLVFELLFRQWRKLPFTCSYLPARQPMALTATRYVFASLFLAPVALLILYSSGEPMAFAALFTLEAAAWWWLHAARQRIWAACTLRFEELPEPDIMALGLPPAGGPLAHSEARAAAPMFASALVESRSLLPEAWSEELAEERHHPSLLLDSFLEDVRYACRLIRRSPLLSAVVVLTLTVGIGINASVFTVINGLALRAHVYHDPASFLRVIPYAQAQNTWRAVSYSEYVAFRDQARSMRHLAAYTWFRAQIGDDDSSDSIALAGSCNFFAVEGLDRPIVGRLFVAEDCQAPGQAPVAVMSESVWHSRFASDPRAVGRVVRVNNRPVTLIGVVPDRTSGWTRPPGLWLPYTAVPYFYPGHNIFQREEFLWLSLAGRLAPGFSRSHAEAELKILAHQQDRLHSGRRTGILATDGSWASELELTASGRNLMLIGFFLGAFNLVLVISCANVATLLLSRAAARKREIAVRLSLGAPRIRLVRMLVTESLLLAAIAGALSLYLATRVPGPLYRLVATRIPDFPMPTDWHTFAYIAAVVLLTGFLSGLAPALESLNVDLTASLKGSGGIFPGGARLRSILVSAQVAMSMVLLVGAGLFAQSENRALRADPGYAPQRVVVAPLEFPENSTPDSARLRLRVIAQRMQALPGARSVAFSDDLPLLRPDTVEVRPPLRPDASQPVDVFTASPGFFETLGIPILRGREFQESDQSAVIVSQTLARMFWPRQDPLGKLLPLPEGAAPVVGVARDIAPLRFGGSDNPPAYRLRRVDAQRNVVLVRFDAGAATAPTAVRTALRQLDPDLMALPRLLAKWFDEITEALWNVVSLIVILGLVATVLTTTGIYGAVSFAVTQKTRDLGIRVALGATRLDIMREVLISGGKPVLHGLIVGLWLSVATAAALRESVKGSPIRLDSTDPLLYCGIVLLLAAAALGAMLGPARRGAQSDPLDALRCE